MSENWKDIGGYEGLYRVSDLGRVAGIKSGKTLKPRENRGYLKVVLSKDGRMKNFFVHRLVAKAFVPNVANKPFVNHLDEDKTNNVASNLEWCTRRENNNWGTRTERAAKAEGRPVEQLDADGNLLATFYSMHDAGGLLGVSYTSISKCCRGRLKTAGGYKWRYG